ncbi:MAG: GTP-binding protein [Promethearchaeota archaeon]|nr:MAG: GTP-binding protein [Candidatus Lokiarchaeota archaeon]
MSVKSERRFKELFSKFLEIDDDIEAIIVSDREGFVIAGEKRKSVDMELVSVLTGLIKPIIDRFKDEFSSKQYGNSSSFDTEKYRLLFITIDENITLSIVLNNLASIDKISPYAYFLAEKVAQLLSASEDEEVQINIPNFEVESESKASSARIREQLYQLRLDSGGKYRFKFVIIGDIAVGKTSIIRRFVENKFLKDYRATIGLNVTTHKIELYGNELVFSLFDVGAQEYFKRFRKTYYQGAQAAFIVFDLTDRKSFINVEKWYIELKQFINNRQIPILVVGNKTDLTQKRVISYENGAKLVNHFSEKHFEQEISYIETSALTGDNVQDAFSLIAYHFIMRSKEMEEERLRHDLMNVINSILEEKGDLTLSFVTENPYWSPGLQILTEINKLCECEKVEDNTKKRRYEYSNGLVIKNFLFDSIKIKDSDGVFVIFDARNRDTIASEWKKIVIEIIKKIKENKVILVGIQISDDSQWSSLMNQFNINEYLEKKMVSLLFFKISQEYRLEIYDQLGVMLNTIKNLK